MTRVLHIYRSRRDAMRKLQAKRDISGFSDDPLKAVSLLARHRRRARARGVTTAAVAAAAAALAALGTPRYADAVDFIKADNTTNLSSAGSWVNNAVPTGADALVWNS